MIDSYLRRRCWIDGSAVMAVVSFDSRSCVVRSVSWACETTVWVMACDDMVCHHHCSTRHSVMALSDLVPRLESWEDARHFLLHW